MTGVAVLSLLFSPSGYQNYECVHYQTCFYWLRRSELKRLSAGTSPQTLSCWQFKCLQVSKFGSLPFEKNNIRPRVSLGMSEALGQITGTATKRNKACNQLNFCRLKINQYDPFQLFQVAFVHLTLCSTELKWYSLNWVWCYCSALTLIWSILVFYSC